MESPSGRTGSRSVARNGMIISVHPPATSITVDSLLASAAAEERLRDRAHAIADLLPHLDAGQRDRVFDLAMEMPDERSRELLIEGLLPHLDGRRLAAVTEAAATRTGLQLVLIPRLKQQQQQELIEGLLAEAEAGHRDVACFVALRPLLSTDQVSRIGRLLLADEDPQRALQALRPWIPLLPAETRRAALPLVRAACSSDWALARTLADEWIAHLSPDEARQLLPLAAGLDRNARAELLPALTAVLPEAAPAALDALRHGRGTGRMIPAVAQALSPADRSELLTVLASPPAEDLPELRRLSFPLTPRIPTETLRPLLPLLDESRLAWVLQLCESGPYPHDWLDAAALCLPHLSAPLRTAVQDRVVEQMRRLASIRPLPKFIGPLHDHQYDGISERRDLLPTAELLREEQYQALTPFAFTLPMGDAVGLITLAHRLDRAQRDAALRIVDRLHPLDDRATLIRALAPFLDDDQIEVAATLPALAGVDPGNLLDMTTALAVSAAGATLHARLTATAMTIAETMTDEYHRGCALVDLAGLCRTEPARHRALHAAIRLFPELDHIQRTVIRRRAAHLLTSPSAIAAT
ncbi:hypothetical protein [Actinoplanes sp. CA-252034]|uniref:hypothetical protein n=1 Tax=Actinoplanes sp. CA-252034 TaxID=3239906 RepID=UPI003D9597E1